MAIAYNRIRNARPISVRSSCNTTFSAIGFQPRYNKHLRIGTFNHRLTSPSQKLHKNRTPTLMPSNSALYYPNLSEVNTTALSHMLNKQRVRHHLVEHEIFTEETLTKWIDEKETLNQHAGNWIRAIQIDDNLAGWCGIQEDGECFEIAIVIDDAFWGAGVQIYKHLLKISAELGHKTVWLRLLDSRKPYRFLTERALQIQSHKFMGREFLAYEVSTNALQKTSD